MGNFREKPLQDNGKPENRYTSERERFFIQCTGRGGGDGLVFNYTTTEIREAINKINRPQTFRSKQMK